MSKTGFYAFLTLAGAMLFFYAFIVALAMVLPYKPIFKLGDCIERKTQSYQVVVIDATKEEYIVASAKINFKRLTVKGWHLPFSDQAYFTRVDCPQPRLPRWGRK